MIIEVIKKNYIKVLRRCYSNKKVKCKLTFERKWKLFELNLIKVIKKALWPKCILRANRFLKLIQTEISRLSLAGSDKIAMKLIKTYSMNIVIRYIAINKIASNSGEIPGVDNFIIKKNSHKLQLLSQSKYTKLKLFSVMKVKLVKISKLDGLNFFFGINTMFDRIVQAQLCLLLNPFYEAKFPEHMYAFRKGRNAIQAVGFLKAILEKSDISCTGLIFLEIKKDFYYISHEAIIEHFIVPDNWKSFVVKWLKAETFKNKIIPLKLSCNVVSGSTIGPIICNAIITKALFNQIEKLVFFDQSKDTNLLINKTIDKNFQKKNYRHAIAHANNLIITTSNINEINRILKSVLNSFQKFGLYISKKKFCVIKYVENRKIKFNYLNFVFNYVPIKYIKSGGILTRYDSITKRKSTKIQKGTYLVYPNTKKFSNIKNKCKLLVRILLRKSVIEVLNKINPVIREFTNYYAWANSSNRLKTFDGLLFRYFKKYLIRKFKNKRIRWVVESFMLCKAILDPIGKFTSPYNLKWHSYTKFVNKNTQKWSENALFLVLPSMLNKILPITSTILPKSLRVNSYYLLEQKFVNNSAQLYAKRIHSDNFKEKFFIKQKNICPFCYVVLVNNDKNDFFLDIVGNNLEIYFNNDIVKIQEFSKISYQILNSLNSFVLLRKSCYFE